MIPQYGVINVKRVAQNNVEQAHVYTVHASQFIIGIIRFVPQSSYTFYIRWKFLCIILYGIMFNYGLVAFIG